MTDEEHELRDAHEPSMSVQGICGECGFKYPCPTIRLLDRIAYLEKAVDISDTAFREAADRVGELERLNETQRQNWDYAHNQLAQTAVALGAKMAANDALETALQQAEEKRVEVTLALAAAEARANGLGSCDWGNCGNPSVDVRWDEGNRWLPVCIYHTSAFEMERELYEQAEARATAAERQLDLTYTNQTMRAEAAEAQLAQARAALLRHHDVGAVHTMCGEHALVYHWGRECEVCARAALAEGESK